MKPWDNRDTIKPRRTYSGKITYKRQKHYFDEKDVVRILKKVEGTWNVRDVSTNAIELLVSTIFAFMMEALRRLEWIDPWGITTKLQMYLQRFIMEIIGMTSLPFQPWTIVDLIYSLASKAPELIVEIKWRK